MVEDVWKEIAIQRGEKISRLESELNDRRQEIASFQWLANWLDNRSRQETQLRVVG